MGRLSRKFNSSVPSPLILPLLLLIFLPSTQAEIPLQKRTSPPRTYEGQARYPTNAQFSRFFSSLKGDHSSKLDESYKILSPVANMRVMQSPGRILLPATTKDVQKIVVFAKMHNLHMTIRSSGSSYIGRSTHGGGVVVNLSKMKGMKVNLNSERNPAGEITVESGATWGEVYDKVDSIKGPGPNGEKKIGRVVVGGSDDTIAIGGYTLGGGHSPIGRKYGLAVDNLLEAQIVTADGKLLTLTSDKTIIDETNGTKSESNDTSLFWAIRGGGGSTWGVVVTFTFALHYAPPRVRKLMMMFMLSSPLGGLTNQQSVKTSLSEMSKLSEDWGGHIEFTPMPQSMVVHLYHMGNDSSPSNSEVDDLLTKTASLLKIDRSFETFLESKGKTPAKEGENSLYIANTFIKASTIDKRNELDRLVGFIYGNMGDGIGCTLTMIGGQGMQSNAWPATPVHPTFRDGAFSASCSKEWGFDPLLDTVNVRKMLDKTEKLYKFGEGSYFNEPAEDMADWKKRFWNDDLTYYRLLDIKKQYDPDNYFWCHNCVGSDMGAGYGSGTTTDSWPDQITEVDFGPSCDRL